MSIKRAVTIIGAFLAVAICALFVGQCILLIPFIVELNRFVNGG